MSHNSIDRRRFLQVGAAGAAALATVRLTPAGAQAPETTGATGATRRPVVDPFTLADQLPGDGGGQGPKGQ